MKTSKKMPLKILQYAMLVLFAFLVSICLSIMIQMKIHPDRVPSIFGYKPFVVLSGSMEAEIVKGDLAITKEIDADTLQKNDVVAFWDKQGHVVTHRIVDIVEKNGEKQLVTKGDNNNANDADVVSIKDVEGKYLFKLSGFGNFVLMLQEPLTLFIILAVIVVVGVIWIMIGKNKLSKNERKELEKLRKERAG